MSVSDEAVDGMGEIVKQMKSEALRLKEMSEGLKGMDGKPADPSATLQKLEGIMAQFTGENKLMELSEKLKSIMSKYDDLSEDEKLEFETKARGQLADKLAEIKNIATDITKEKVGQALADNMYSTVTIVLCCVVVFSLFAFFGYKLYKSLKDKELKREEKKKLKQLKKKK